MNKGLAFLVLLLLLFACNKEKKSLRQLDGEWQISSYQESIFDGTTNMFDLIEGSAKFETKRNSKEGHVNLQWEAVFQNDTTVFNIDGKFKQEALDELYMTSSADSVTCEITRQLKKDMTLQMVVNPNRKTLIHLRKK